MTGVPQRRSRLKWSTWPSYGRVFGARLKHLRQLRGLTQARLGELCGMSRNQISNLERNDNNAQHTADPTLSTVYKLAQALYVPPAVLLPSGSDLVGGVSEMEELQSGNLSFELSWPNNPTDYLAFDSIHILTGKATDAPTFAPKPPDA